MSFLGWSFFSHLKHIPGWLKKSQRTVAAHKRHVLTTLRRTLLYHQERGTAAWALKRIWLYLSREMQALWLGESGDEMKAKVRKYVEMIEGVRSGQTQYI